MERPGTHGIVLAGRPYHNDPEINHAIPELLTSFGLAVLTEDSIAHLGTLERPIRLVDQWMYHTRLYAAPKVARSARTSTSSSSTASAAALDALTTDQVQEILEPAGKVYTVLKIDEVSNLGAARIRDPLACMAALKEAERGRGAVSADAPTRRGARAWTEQGRCRARLSSRVATPRPAAAAPQPPKYTLRGQRPRCRRFDSARGSTSSRAPFTEQMRDEGYTILCPQMAPIHFRPAHRDLPALRLQLGAAALGRPRRGGRRPAVREQRHLLSVDPGHGPDHGGRR